MNIQPLGRKKARQGKIGGRNMEVKELVGSPRNLLTLVGYAGKSRVIYRYWSRRQANGKGRARLQPPSQSRPRRIKSGRFGLHIESKGLSPGDTSAPVETTSTTQQRKTRKEKKNA